MIKSIFGDLKFDTGWKTNGEIALFGRNYRITIKARAYYEKDGITDAQGQAFLDYKDAAEDRVREAEDMLSAYSDDGSTNRYTPRTLLFDRDGGYALLCDDAQDPDDGVAVVFKPTGKVMSQNDYL